ncbi:MAG: hypothetical protein IJF07_02220 [Lachnospiraceae bacterium]|nr:hypothetical protein [Lachnospiraceae bacterium]
MKFWCTGTISSRIDWSVIMIAYIKRPQRSTAKYYEFKNKDCYMISTGRR